MLKQRVPLLSVLLCLLVLTVGAWASRNSGGSYSLPSGNPVVSGTTITSTWANTTLNDISTELTNSLDRQGRGGMLAPLKLVAGSSATPSLSWTLEPGSGPYRAGAGDIRWSILTTDVWKMQSSLVTTLVPLTVTGRTTTTNLTVTGTSEALVVTPTTGTNVNAIQATGRGTSAGLLGVGGSSNGSGVVGIGNGTGAGMQALGAAGGVAAGMTVQSGGLGGNGLEVTTLAGSYVGILSTGHGSGAGISATGGATSGDGITALGGAPNGHGIHGFGTGTGAGVFGEGGLTGPGITATSGTAATATVRQDNIRSTNGDISLAGVANPNSDVVISNRITPKNITKAWGAFTIGAGGAVTITDGFNIASVVSSGSACGGATQIDVAWAAPFASSTSYAVVAGSASSGPVCDLGPRVISQNSAQVSIGFLATRFDAVTPSFGTPNCQQVACGAGASATHDWNGMKFTLIATGAQ